MKKETGCSKIREIINDFVYDKEISSENRKLFFNHIKECPDCDKHYQTSCYLKNNISSTASFFEPSDEELTENRKKILSKIEEKKKFSLLNSYFLSDIGLKPVYANIVIFVFLFSFSIILFKQDHQEQMNKTVMKSSILTSEAKTSVNEGIIMPVSETDADLTAPVLEKTQSFVVLKRIPDEISAQADKESIGPDLGIEKKIPVSKKRIAKAKIKLEKEEKKIFSPENLVAIKPSAIYSRAELSENAALAFSDTIEKEDFKAKPEIKTRSFAKISSAGKKSEGINLFSKFYKNRTYLVKIISKDLNHTSGFIKKILDKMKIENEIIKSDNSVVINGKIPKNKINLLKKQILADKKINLSIFPKKPSLNTEDSISMKLSIKISH